MQVLHWAVTALVIACRVPQLFCHANTELARLLYGRYKWRCCEPCKQLFGPTEKEFALLHIALASC